MLLSKYGSVIESRKTDGISLKGKEKAWYELTSEFNSHLNVTTRSVKQIKYLYQNLKRSAKKDYSERGDTVGGFIPASTETASKIIALIGDEIEPLHNNEDCDAEYRGDIDPANSTSSDEILSPASTVVLQDESHTQSTAAGDGEHLDNGRSKLGAPPTSKKRGRFEAARFLQNIADMAEHSASLYEMEREHMIRKFKKEQELLDIKIENAKLKQLILKKQLDLH